MNTAAIKRHLATTEKSTWYTLASIGLILIVGSIFTLVTEGTLSFLEPLYILQQMQIASFLGIAATGMMVAGAAGMAAAGVDSNENSRN